jgi:hypothetical protein
VRTRISLFIQHFYCPLIAYETLPSDCKFLLQIIDFPNEFCSVCVRLVIIIQSDPLRRYEAGQGTIVGIAGIGGLGQMGIKLAKAMGCTCDFSRFHSVDQSPVESLIVVFCRICHWQLHISAAMFLFALVSL